VRRLRVVLVAITAWAVLGPVPASAQQVDPAVDDLRDHDVTFEEEAPSSSELDQLDATVAQLQSHDGYIKVVVLAVPIEDFDTGRDFADRVREGLGGQGRVLVWSPHEVALSSNLDTPEEISNAEQAAADRINSGGSLASATGAAAEALGADAGGVTADPRGGGGVPWLLLLLIIGIPLVLLWVLWRSVRKQRERATASSAEEIGAAETKVRSAVDKVANDQPQTRLPMDDDVFGQWGPADCRRRRRVRDRRARDVRWRQERGPGGHAERTQSWPGDGSSALAVYQRKG
jgi:hypothetical protein